MTAYMPQAQRTNHGTPKPLFNWINERFGPIVLDVAATKRNAVVERYINSVEDGLATPWWGVVYCNPPYGNGLTEWIDKAIIEVSERRATRVVMLLPAYTDRSWYPKIHTFASHIIFITGRLHFRGSGGSAPMANMIVVIEPHNGNPIYEVRHRKDLRA